MPELPRDLPHIHLKGVGLDEPYTTKARSRLPAPPPRDREAHAQKLVTALNRALEDANAVRLARPPELPAPSGFYLEFRLPADSGSIVERLEDRRRKIELVSVKRAADEASVVATVFVPQAAANHFMSKVEAYRTQDTKKGKPKNEALVSRVDAVALAAVQSVYTDSVALPPTPDEWVWWEVWIREGHRAEFEDAAQRLHVPVAAPFLHFPEREVVLAHASQPMVGTLLLNTDAIAELRRAKDTPAVFLQMNNLEQAAWVADLLARVRPPTANTIAVCLLDSGITRQHPLLAPAIDPADVYTYDPAWPPTDSDAWCGHGTSWPTVCRGPRSEYRHDRACSAWPSLKYRCRCWPSFILVGSSGQAGFWR